MRLLAIICIFSLFIACKKEEVKEIPSVLGHKILISNEGNFGWGEGSLSIYDPVLKKVDNDVYKTLNNKTLGNVFQSIQRINNHYYLVINNSAKIVILDSAFKHVAEIQNFNSPRNIIQVSATKAYVTDLYADKLWIVDLNTNTISGSIAIHGWLEAGLSIGDEFVVGSMESDYIYTIDVQKDELVDSIKVAYATQSLIQDDNGVIWLLSQGNGSDKKARLSKWYPEEDTLVASTELDGLPSHLKYYAGQSELYFLNQNVYSLNVNSNVVQPKIIIDLTGINAYGFGLDKTNGDLYISDVHDFVSQSSIHRYSNTADKIDEFKAGIISGSFY